MKFENKLVQLQCAEKANTYLAIWLRFKKKKKKKKKKSMNYATLDVTIWSQNKKFRLWNKKNEIWLVNKDHAATCFCEGRLKANIVSNIVYVTF